MRQNKLPVIGVYPLTNTGSLCVHALEGDQVRVSLNGEKPEWLDIIERPLSERTGENSDGGDWESGFMWGSLFVSFSEVMRN